MDDSLMRELVAIIDKKFSEQDARIEKNIREQVALAVDDAMKKNRDCVKAEQRCTVGMADLLWPFRRFWIPVCPKIWVDFKPD